MPAGRSSQLRTRSTRAAPGRASLNGDQMFGRWPSMGASDPDPEHGRRQQAGALHRHPDRLAAPPHRVLILDAVAHRQAAAGWRVLDRVGDDAVVAGVEAGDDRVVVREGLGGIARNQVRAHASGRQAGQVGRGVRRAVVPAPAVERNQDEGRLGVLAEENLRASCPEDEADEHEQKRPAMHG